MRISREIIGTGVTAILTRTEVAIATIETGARSTISATGRRSHLSFPPERSISGKDRVAITTGAFLDCRTRRVAGKGMKKVLRMMSTWEAV
jgi:hypothetical protein